MCRRPEEGWHLVALICRRHSLWFFVKRCQPNTNTGNIVNPSSRLDPSIAKWDSNSQRMILINIVSLDHDKLSINVPVQHRHRAILSFLQRLDRWVSMTQWDSNSNLAQWDSHSQPNLKDESYAVSLDNGQINFTNGVKPLSRLLWAHGGPTCTKD